MALDHGPVDSPTIVIVEDEELVALYLVESLQEAGFTVRHLRDAAPLFAMINDPAIVAAVIDVGLPGVRGDELALACRTIRPTLPIILATGYDEHRFEDAVAKDSYLRVLGKPFDLTRLFNLLEGLGVRQTENFVSRYS